MKKGERTLIWILCVVAALRVFVFAAAFPFFNNVDEQAHVDLVLRYAHDDLPRGLGQMLPEAAYYFALYGTPEYFNKATQFPNGEFPRPLWLLPPEKLNDALQPLVTMWRAETNQEIGEPPLYYALAASLWKLGSFLGVRSGFLLYLLRFVNIGIAAALVWIGYIAARLAFPERSFPRIAVSSLIAFFPQAALYSIQSDVLSPFFFGIAFVGLLRLFGNDQPNVSTGVWTGLSLAAACLTKTANVPLFIFAALALALKVLLSIRAQSFRRYLSIFAVLGTCAIVPVAGWMAWNYHAFGEVTASAAKIQHLGWTRKPIGEWWAHPLFSLHGLRYFWSELTASFWRGEFIWHGERLALGAADAFYWISSALALVTVLIALFLRRGIRPLERAALWLALGSFVIAVVFLAGLSIAFDFGTCPYPSRENPYFTSGRLLGGAMIPFLLLYAFAVEQLTAWIKQKWLPFVLLAIIVAGVTTSELIVNWPVFSSRYNFFHMLSDAKSQAFF